MKRESERELDRIMEKQLQRITHMEQLMENMSGALEALSRAAEDYLALRPQIRELTAYYESELWRQDFEDDSAGKLPAQLKRGVLSEDGLYDLLCEQDRLLSELAALARERRDLD